MTLDEANRFKEARKKAGFTQKQLADKLGISVSPIYYLENASGSVAIGTVEAVAAEVGLRIQIVPANEPDDYPKTRSGKRSPETPKKKI